jgi:hypothetical protein
MFRRVFCEKQLTILVNFIKHFDKIVLGGVSIWY